MHDRELEPECSHCDDSGLILETGKGKCLMDKIQKYRGNNNGL